jgi:ATP-binding protein involved in chromosome partitioning
MEPENVTPPLVSAAVVPPSVDDVTDLLRAVIDPELGSDVVDLGMASCRSISSDGFVVVDVKLTIGGCPLRAQIKKDIETRVATHPGVRGVKIEWGEMTSEERSATMAKARWNAREKAPDTAIPATTRVLAVSSGKGGVGKSSVTVNLAAAIAAQGYTVGVLDADIWGFSVPRMLGLDQRLEAAADPDTGRPRIRPNTRVVGDGLLKVVSTGFLVDDEGTALMWRGLMLTKALEQFLRDVAWGELDYLVIDMPPGTGDVQMGLARMLPRTDMIIVTTPAVSAQKVAIRAADMARRSFLRIAGVIENMSEFVCDHGERYPLFGRGGGQALADEIGVPLLGQIPLEPHVAAGSDSGEPVAVAGSGPAAVAFRSIAHQLVTETIPPVQMSQCSARRADDADQRGFTEVSVGADGVVIESVTPVSLRGGQ